MRWTNRVPLRNQFPPRTDPCRRLAVHAVGLIVTVGCSAHAQITNLHSHGTAIICFGNSLTEGVGASPGHDYPSLLAHALGREVINAGVGGNSTADALERLDRDVLTKDPRLVIVEFGGNDFLRGVPIETVFANLDTIVQRIQAAGAMVVIVGVQPGLLGDATRTDYQRLAHRWHAAFVPNILDGILTNPQLKSDELHPNDAGYEHIAQRLLNAIQPLLEPS